MTEKPRITVTLEQQDYELVKRVAKASGMTMSALLRDYVEMSRPMLTHMADLADALEAAASDRREAHVQTMNEVLDEQQRKADRAQGQLDFAMGFLDFMTIAAKEQLSGDGGGGLLVGMTPTVNNMGVRFTECLPVEEKEVDKTKPKRKRKQNNNKEA